MISNNELKEADDACTPDVYDTYLNMELAIPKGDSLEPRLARVTKRLKDANGLPIGLANENPILDTRMYEVEYVDGEQMSLADNNIAKNLFTQIDNEGNRQVLMDEIIGHWSNKHTVKNRKRSSRPRRVQGDTGKQQKVGNYLYDGRTVGLIG